MSLNHTQSLEPEITETQFCKICNIDHGFYTGSTLCFLCCVRWSSVVAAAAHHHHHHSTPVVVVLVVVPLPAVVRWWLVVVVVAVMSRRRSVRGSNNKFYYRLLLLHDSIRKRTIMHRISFSIFPRGDSLPSRGVPAIRIGTA